MREDTARRNRSISSAMIRVSLSGLLLIVVARAASTQVLDVRELHPSQIASLDRSRTVVLLVGGILEEHGPFLPSYADGYQTEFLASRLAEAIASRPGWTVLRLPTIPLGAEPASDFGGQFAFPGSYPVRSSTLRAVFMDLLTDLGDQGFKWGFILDLHGAPLHNRALDEAARYFSDTYGGRMVHLTGLVSVGRSAPRDVFSRAQVEAEGFSVHADADEHSRVLFLRPDLVSPAFMTARPVVGHGFDDLLALAKQPDWPGYFGTPAIGTAAAGARVMNAIAQATIDAALKVLDGVEDSTLRHMASEDAADPDVKKVVDGSLDHERAVEHRQDDWMARQHQ